MFWYGLLRFAIETAMITDTRSLKEFCDICAKHPFVTIDTEFHRERTYYSQLCLLQIAYPGEGEESAVLVDTLSDDLDLEPIYDLFRNPDVVKVFHAARQDLEIFFVEAGIFPEPFFDTQVAAMVCGFGEQVGYETLVRSICKAGLDKSSRFTDWTQRPLTAKQQAYALADVTHLRDIYTYLRKELEKSGRAAWVEEELAVLTCPATYELEPREAWRRIKSRNTNGTFLSILRELAELREVEARSRNVPRNRIIKDDAIVEIAGTKPKDVNSLNKSRLLLREARKGDLAEKLLAAIKRGVQTPSAEWPVLEKPAPRKQGHEALAELLRVLLKACASREGVAQKLIATTADLDRLANEDEPDIAAMHGWRLDVFGRDAQRLKGGEVALSADGSQVKIVELT